MPIVPQWTIVVFPNQIFAAAGEPIMDGPLNKRGKHMVQSIRLLHHTNFEFKNRKPQSISEVVPSVDQRIRNDCPNPRGHYII
ncbi:MAG: hypothetical protein ACK5YR_19565 [Pirellula sp.]